MNLPNFELMKQYGTEDVFLAKTAGAEPLLTRLGLSALNYALAESNQNADKKQKLEDAQRTEAVREYELEKMRPATDGLRHTRAPMLVPAGSDIPVGWDEGMVRLASLAAQTGAELAKEAGIGDFVGMAKSLGSKVMPALKGLGTAAAPWSSSMPTAATPAAGATGLLSGAKKFLGGGLGLKGNLALAGGTIGAGLLASKAMHAGTRAMGRESAGPPVYGTPTRGVGYQLPTTINQWGQPQVG